jgi:hypothetical protein
MGYVEISPFGIPVPAVLTTEFRPVAPAVSRSLAPPALIPKHLFARYDQRLRQLVALRRRLPQVPPTEDDLPPSVATPEAPPAVFTTCFGDLTFEALYQRTYKYATVILHRTYHLQVEEIEDGLQGGYLALWQRLCQQPDLLADKSLAWIGRFIAYGALHATRSDWQFKKRTETGGREDTPAGSSTPLHARAHSWETRSVDLRLDLHAAIVACAQTLLDQPVSKSRDHDMWALYGLLMLDACAAETSRLFAVREQSMQAAYTRVRRLLQQRLRDYTPRGKTTPTHGRGQKKRPQQELHAIRQANAALPPTSFAAVKAHIEALQADTMAHDLLALAGIQASLPVQTHAKAQGVPTHQMQRAYTRVHLMLGALRDPTIRVRRPERRLKPLFTLTAETAAAVHQLALEFLEDPKSYPKLVALYAHINNFAVSTTAKQFNIPTATLRLYNQQIGARLGTPKLSARQNGSIASVSSPTLPDSADIFSSAAR